MSNSFLAIDCPCIDVSSTFLAAANCAVGNNGNNFTHFESLPKELGVSVYGSDGKSACFPSTYGSGSCKQHDLSGNPSCNGKLKDGNNESIIPDFCFNSWCYVDREKCKNSDEVFLYTDLMGFLGIDLYYSYSTCNSSTTDWTDFYSTEVVKNESIPVSIPEIWYPVHYKVNDTNGDNITNIVIHEEVAYFNDTIPWKVSIM